MLSSFFIVSFFAVLAFLVFLVSSFFIESFFIGSSFFIVSCLVSSYCIESWLLDRAKAAIEAAKINASVRLLRIFFMVFSLEVSIELRSHGRFCTCWLKRDEPGV
jgi:short subunit fatty acids transporter